jgi:hypothetical protein
MNRWNVTGRWLQVAALIVKEHVRLQDCQNPGLIHAARKNDSSGETPQLFNGVTTRSWAGAFRAVIIAISTIFLYSGSSLRRFSSSFCMNLKTVVEHIPTNKNQSKVDKENWVMLSV